jgi:RNA polymerase sigma-70 factor (ECF subfamily)
MDDRKIIELFFERSEKAIDETEKKYGRYISAVVDSILASREDTEEVVNDTYLRAWNAIPPSRPRKLGAYLAAIARNLALDRYAARRKERENVAAEAILDELADCLPESKSLSPADEFALKQAVNSFLASLDAKTRVVFMRRYWYMMPIAKIAFMSGMSESNVKTVLHRTRIAFREHLEKEGITV